MSDTNPTARARAALMRELQRPTEWIDGDVGTTEREAVRLLDAFRAEVLAEAEAEIVAAIERNRAEHPDEDTMTTRRLGMRAAERIVWSLRLDGGDQR